MKDGTDGVVDAINVEDVVVVVVQEYMNGVVVFIVMQDGRDYGQDNTDGVDDTVVVQEAERTMILRKFFASRWLEYK